MFKSFRLTNLSSGPVRQTNLVNRQPSSMLNITVYRILSHRILPVARIY